MAKGKRRKGRRAQDVPKQRAHHPPPAMAIRKRHEDFKSNLARRDDEISQLLARSTKTSEVGDRTLIQGSLSEEEHEELRTRLKDGTPRFARELADRVSELRSMLLRADGQAVLTRIAVINIMKMWGDYYEPTAEGSEAEVEFLAGLLLTQGPGVGEPPTPELTQEVLEALDEIFDVARLLNLARGVSEGDETADVRYAAKAQWLSIRGSAYEQHATILAHAVLDEWAEQMRQRLGFNLDDLIATKAAVVALIEDRYNDLLRASLEEVERAAVEIRATTGKGESLLAGASIDEFRKWLVMQLWEKGITDALTFSAQDILERSDQLTAERVSALLERLSVEIGSLERDQYRSPFDQSPLQDTPFVRFNNTYLLPVPGHVAREPSTLLERHMREEFKKFDVHRARALDHLAVDCIARMLSPAEAYVGLFYPNPDSATGELTECDGLVILDRYAIVVEGKGTPLSSPGRRGDVVRATRDLRRSLGDAAMQGDRVRRYILSGLPAVFHDAAGAEIFRIDAAALDEVFIVNPTLHEMGDYALHPERLKTLGLTESAKCLSIYINDLQIIADVVNEPAEFLYYLTWRARLPLGTRIEVVDEIDLFASYLLREQFRELENNETDVVTLTGSTTDFDAFYMGESGHGPPAKKPEMFNVPPIRRFVRRMSRDRPPGWLAAAGVCLDLSLEELAFVGVRMQRSRPEKAGEVSWMTFEGCTLIQLGPSVRWQSAWSQFVRQGTPAKHVVFVDTKNSYARLVWALATADAQWG